MTFVDIDDLPAADPTAPELEMVRSLIASLQTTQAQIAWLQAREATLYTSVVELVELQAKRLPEGATARPRDAVADGDRRDRDCPADH